MLDRSKLLLELHKIETQVVAKTNECQAELKASFHAIASCSKLSGIISARKWSLLVPIWHEALAQTFQIKAADHPYFVLAVDGSQIYFDKHQGPACYLINIGSVLFKYGLSSSSVVFSSHPELIVATSQDRQSMAPEMVDLHRESNELQTALSRSIEAASSSNGPFVCMLDGSLIFFTIDLTKGGEAVNYFAQYMAYFEQMHQHKILHVAYMSFPRTKDLLNVVRLAQAEYCDVDLKNTDHWQDLTDMDVARLFLRPGTRSAMFCSKAPISYAYPAALKPYFCYINVGEEIVRLEFPAWIALDGLLVDKVCSIVLNQTEKGGGYPVALFEAHEQAVVNAAEREFFYDSIRRMYLKNSHVYQNSRKSSKKSQVPI